MKLCRRLFVFHPGSSNNVDTMRRRAPWLLPLYLVIACSTRTSPRVLPAPTLPPTVTSSPSAIWTFNLRPGAAHYRISRSAAVTRSDSAGGREVTTNITHEVITLVPAGDSAIDFTAVIDTFSTTTQGLIGSVQPTHTPVQLSGVLAGNNLTINSDSIDPCSPVSSALLSDLHGILTRFPPRLSRGLFWQDSLAVSGCQADIPTTSRTIRTYIVLGEAIYENQPVVLVQRADTIRAHGEGAQQQHRLTLDAEGTGNAVYYLDTKDGRLIRLTADQELSLTVLTSGKPYQFRQSSRQDFRLTP
jgi:hypothetical protein